MEDIDEHLKIAGFNDIDIVNKFIKKYPCENSYYNICNLFTWDLALNLKYMIYQDRLILFNPFFPYLLEPIGEKFSVEELVRIHCIFEKKYKNVEILAVSEDYINNNKANLSGYFDIRSDENLNDYIYLAENLVKLSGKKLAKKKNLISQFKKLYPDFTVNPIEKNDYIKIIEFYHHWKNTHNAEGEHLDSELEAIKIILTNWDLLPCNGLKLCIGSKMCAFSIFSPQTADMATVHFEKYDAEIKGAGQIINHETAKALLNDYKYINREQDMGSVGIRQAKRSYQPIKMLPFYRLKSK